MLTPIQSDCLDSMGITLWMRKKARVAQTWLIPLQADTRAVWAVDAVEWQGLSETAKQCFAGVIQATGRVSAVLLAAAGAPWSHGIEGGCFGNAAQYFNPLPSTIVQLPSVTALHTTAIARKESYTLLKNSGLLESNC